MKLFSFYYKTDIAISPSWAILIIYNCCVPFPVWIIKLEMHSQMRQYKREIRKEKCRPAGWLKQAAHSTLEQNK